ncbi:translation initiation factor eIF3 subunit [Auricularia subglabra TFB-10046 SS5]|nr:translation initiation factor eIF3 subunit [Auricularia subglabra TFB-10046 SS5]
MSDWENSDSEPSAPAKAPAPIKPAVKSKWEGEDEDDNGGGAAWDESSEDEDKPKRPIGAATATAPRKKGTLKAKLAQKEAERAARIAAGEDPGTEDEFLDEVAVKRQQREAELAADLGNAEDLLGGGGTQSQAAQLNALLTFSPKTKDDFAQLSDKLINLVLKQHMSKPLYPTFCEMFARELAAPLRDVETRKVASTLTALANEKQKEQRDKTSGKNKKKTASKPALGLGKVAAKLDTSVYEDSLDDFGKNDDDFM